MMTTQVIAISPEFRHLRTAQQHPMSWDQLRKASALLKIVRASTGRFKDVAVAEAEQCRLQFGCVNGDYSGAMGLHVSQGQMVPESAWGRSASRVVLSPSAGAEIRMTGACSEAFAKYSSRRGRKRAS